MTEPTPLHRRRYTKRQKATAVIAAELSTVAAAAEQTGFPERTIAYWVEHPSFAELRAKTREEASVGWSVIQHLALARLRELIPTMEARDLTILAGVAVDKGQLLSGQATSRAEHKDLTDGWDDHERETLGRLLRDAAETEVVDAGG